MKQWSGPALAVAAMMLAVGPGAAVAPVATTEITLEGPEIVLAGTTVEFGGAHRARFGGFFVPATRVQLYVDNMPAGTDFTSTGAWAITHRFPTRGLASVQAVAEEDLPQESRSRILQVVVAVAPQPPSGFVAQAASGARRVDVSWSAPSDDGGAPILGYDVSRRMAGSAWMTIASLGSGARTYRDDGLTLGTSYEYGITARNAVGVSTRSETPVAGAPPTPPTLTATMAGGSATVQLAGAATGGTTQRLEYQRSLDHGTSWAVVAAVDGLASTVPVSIDFAAPTPLFRALARSVVGDSAPSAALVEGSLPGAPRDPRMEVTSVLRLRWDPPAEGGPVQQYRVLDRGLPIALAAPSATSAVVSATPGIAHAWSVQALNLLGAGPASAQVAIEPPAPPTLTLTVVSGTNRVRLAAAATDSLAQTLEIQRSLDSGASWGFLASGAAPSFATETGVNLATAPALFRALARGPTGASAAVDAVLEGSPPAEPTSLHVTTDTSVWLRWTPPAGSQGSIVRQDGAIRAVLGATATSLQVPVSNGVPTSFTVQALSYLGNSSQSAPLQVLLATPGAPGAISATTTPLYMAARANLAWSPPASNGGATVTGYEVYRSIAGGPSVYRASVTSPSFSETIDGNGTAYTYTVHARNAVGVGPSVSKSVSHDLGWSLELTITGFRVCDDAWWRGGSCIDVAEGGTYSRGGDPAYVNVTYTGRLLRHGAPQADVLVQVRGWPSFADEHSEAAQFVRTNAAGEFSGSYGSWSTSPSFCTVDTYWTQAFAPSWQVERNPRLTICP